MGTVCQCAQKIQDYRKNRKQNTEFKCIELREYQLISCGSTLQFTIHSYILSQILQDKKICCMYSQLGQNLEIISYILFPSLSSTPSQPQPCSLEEYLLDLVIDFCICKKLYLTHFQHLVWVSQASSIALQAFFLREKMPAMILHHNLLPSPDLTQKMIN